MKIEKVVHDVEEERLITHRQTESGIIKSVCMSWFY
jgi:hypothetical protein